MPRRMEEPDSLVRLAAFRFLEVASLGATSADVEETEIRRRCDPSLSTAPAPTRVPGARCPCLSAPLRRVPSAAKRTIGSRPHSGRRRGFTKRGCCSPAIHVRNLTDNCLMSGTPDFDVWQADLPAITSASGRQRPTNLPANNSCCARLRGCVRGFRARRAAEYPVAPCPASSLSERPTSTWSACLRSPRAAG